MQCLCVFNRNQKLVIVLQLESMLIVNVKCKTDRQTLSSF